jgi:hypothetical protein
MRVINGFLIVVAALHSAAGFAVDFRGQYRVDGNCMEDRIPGSTWYGFTNETPTTMLFPRTLRNDVDRSIQPHFDIAQFFTEQLLDIKQDGSTLNLKFAMNALYDYEVLLKPRRFSMLRTYLKDKGESRIYDVYDRLWPFVGHHATVEITKIESGLKIKAIFEERSISRFTLSGETSTLRSTTCKFKKVLKP